MQIICRNQKLKYCRSPNLVGRNSSHWLRAIDLNVASNNNASPRYLVKFLKVEPDGREVSKRLTNSNSGITNTSTRRYCDDL